MTNRKTFLLFYVRPTVVLCVCAGLAAVFLASTHRHTSSKTSADPRLVAHLGGPKRATTNHENSLAPGNEPSGPSVSALVPSGAVAGSADLVVTVSGSSFVDGFVVRVNGVDRATTFVDSSQLSVTLPAGEIATAGTLSFTVFDPAPTGGESVSLTFTVDNPVPNLTNLSPTSTTAGGPGFTLAVTGSGFTSSTVLNFGSTSHPINLINSGQLTANISAAEIAAGATITVTLTNPAPGGGTSASQAFSINNPLPTLTNLSPSVRFAGDTSFPLTVTGTNFNSSSVVLVNGSGRVTTFVGPTQLTAQIPAGDTIATGVVPVTILNPAPAGGTSNAVALTVSAVPAPSLSSISPNAVSAGSATSITVTGNNFFGGSVVRLNSNNRPTTFVSATLLTVSLTATDLANIGTLPISVFNPAPGGGTSTSNNLTVNPAITSVSPTSVKVGSAGFTLTVNGAGFVSGTRVRWNGSAKSTTFINATKLTASIKSSDLTTVGSVPITVLSPSPTNLSSNAVNVTVTPSITNLVPLTAIAGDPDLILTVTGTGFTAGATVNWNGFARPTTFVNSTKLTAIIPAAEIAVVGAFPVSVTNPAPLNFPSNSLNFNVTDAPPANECPPIGLNVLANPGLINFGPEKSQLWKNDGLWWGAFSNNADGIYFYKQSGSGFTRGPLIHTNSVAGVFVAGSPDTLWNGTNLFILIQESTVLARLYKYNYTSATQTYSLEPGFPVSLPLTGAGTNTSGKFGVISFDQDSTGRLWAAYAGSGVGGDGKVHVLWSTSADHIAWDTVGLILETGISTSTQEAAPVIRFGGNKIGIAWSNQATNEYGFRYHLDADPATVWSVKEIIDSGLGPEGTGGVAENHMSIKSAPDGRLFLIAKDNDGNGHLHLYVRAANGPWGQKTLVVNDFSASPTRAVLLLDIENSELHVVYKDSSATGISRTFITQSFMDKPAFNTPCPFIDTSQSTQNSSNPTGTKQNLDASTDLIVAASTGKRGNTIIFNTLDVTPNHVAILSLSPKEVTAGESLANLVLTINGKLFTKIPSPGSVARINGVETPTSYLNAGKLTTAVQASDLASPGLVSIAVGNPDGSISNTANLVVSATNPPPMISSLSPTRELVGSAQFNLTVNGNGFRRTSVVQFNGIDRPTGFVSDTQLVATILPSDLGVPGPFPITVTNPVPGGGVSTVTRFSTFFVQPPCPTISPQSLAGITVFNTVKSQLWYNDGLWWGALSDNSSGLFFYKQLGATFSKGALIDGNFNGRPDVKWDGSSLFVLVYELNTQAKLYKFTYNSVTKTYTPIAGFPITIPLTGVGTGAGAAQVGSITIEEDTTGKLWAAYPATGPGGEGSIHVVWSTSADHKTWDATGIVLAAGVSNTAQEVAPILRFGANKIGVAWSNQVANEIGFRYHTDGELETNWSAEELVDSGLGSEFGAGGVADNHMSMKAAPDGRIFLVAKDSDGVGYLHLYIRSSAGLWSDAPIAIDPDPQAQDVRPSVVLDLENNELYVFYENLMAGLTFLNHTSLDVPSFGPTCPYVSPTFIANVTTTKQNVNGDMGLWAAGSTGGASSQIYVNPLTLAHSTGNPVPTLAAVAPVSADVGSGPFTLTVTGTNFINGAVVYFNGSDRPTTVDGPTQLRATIMASDLRTLGNFPVRVLNPRGGTSSTLSLTVTPTIMGIAPSSATVGDPGMTITVGGVGFLSGAVVQWNGQPRTTTFVSSTQLSVVLTAADLQSAGTFNITIANPASVASSPRVFTVNNPMPLLSSLSLTSVVSGAPGFTLTVNGSGFVANSVVRFAGSERVTTFANANQLTAEITASDLGVGGMFPIVVFSPGPGGGTSGALDFVVTNPLPGLTSIAPATVAAGSSAFTLALTGQNFVSGAVVQINGSARTTTFINATQLLAQITAADVQNAGVFAVTVVNPLPGGGGSNSTDLLVTNPIPAISSISPDNGVASGAGFILAVNGANFVNGSTVRWNGSDRPTTFVNSTQLTALVTAADNSIVGSSILTVFNGAPGGGSSNSLVFTARERSVTLVDSSGGSGSTITVPVRLDAGGNENAVSFSISFDPSLLNTPVANTGHDAEGATVLTDTTQALEGRYGVTVSLPAGQAFGPGMSEVASLKFNVVSLIAPTNTPLSFDNAPIPSDVRDVNGSSLLATFVPGVATITLGYEGDVSPRPNGSNNGTITIADWALTGRFASGLDAPAPGGEFQRADCAPRNTLGNGTVTLADWVQAGRYASGFDPIVAAGGPTTLSTAPNKVSNSEKKPEGTSTNLSDSNVAIDTIVRMLDTTAVPSRNRSLSIEVDAQGNENALSFGVLFDPKAVTFVSAEPTEEFSVATVNVNAVKAGEGKVGIALALPVGSSFGPGKHQVVVLRFVENGSDAGSFSFTDEPISREVVDKDANLMKALFVDAVTQESALFGYLRLGSQGEILNPGDFGWITSTSNYPRLIQLAAKVNF